MDTALKRVRDYQESAAYNRYSDYTCAVCDDGFEDDILFDGDTSYTLHHYRRASFIVVHRYDGFQGSTEYASESESLQAFESIRDDIDSEQEKEAYSAHPDVWRVIVPTNYPYTYEMNHDSEEDAIAELSDIAVKLYTLEISGNRSICSTIEADTLGAEFEIMDSEKATMSNFDLVGIYSIEHIDRSEQRENYLETVFY